MKLAGVLLKHSSKKPATLPANSWRNRIIGYGEIDPSELLANPKNWRIHPESQKEALGAILDQVGWVQVAAIVNKTTGFVVDGHLRVSLAIARKEPSIPVGYVDLTEKEENLILASFDPIANAALTDSDKLSELLGGIDFSSEALDSMFAGLLEEGEITTLKDATESDGSRQMGDKATQIKPVLYAAQIAVFEQALRATGEKNRGAALIEVCQFYLDNNEGNTEGQFDIQPESLTTD